MSANIAGADKNRQTLHDPLFLKACELAQIQPTHRQASKWNNGYGKALRFRREARAAIRAAETAQVLDA
jgi:hypothetical protein